MVDFRTETGSIQDDPGTSVVPESKEIMQTNRNKIQIKTHIHNHGGRRDHQNPVKDLSKAKAETI